MRASLRSWIAVVMVFGFVGTASAIEPVGSASRGTPVGESSRRAPTSAAAPATAAAPAFSGTKNGRVTAPTAAPTPAIAQPAGAQSASAQLAAAPPALLESAPPQSVAAMSPAARAGGPFGWQTNVEEACRLARQHNLPVLVLVTSAHCPYCTKMKEQTFRTTAVIKEVDANFVPLRIERGSNPALERRLGVKSYPTTVVLRSDQAEMARMAGFIQAPQFLGNLKKIEAQWPTLSASRPTKLR